MKIGSLKLKESSEANIRLLPCLIEFDGEANPEGYLQDTNESSIFGRKLQGSEVEIPSGMKGLIADGVNDLSANEYFSHIRYWNWDKSADSSDKIHSLTRHINLMKSLSD